MDDSIVRGNTTKAIVGMLREAGAREVHLRITSPPMRWPCFYGIDFPTRAELVASDLLTHEVAAYLGGDSLGYLSLEALVEAAAPWAPRGVRGSRPASQSITGSLGLCAACFTGDYPIPVEPHPQGKVLLESIAPDGGVPDDGSEPTAFCRMSSPSSSPQGGR